MSHFNFFLNFLSGIFLLSLFVAIPCCADSDHTIEEWQEILAIGDEIDKTLGGELTLEITPPLYYLEKGTELSLFGTIRGLFGPLKNSRILISQWNSNGSIKEDEVITDDEGSFIINYLLMEEGIYRFRANYSYIYGIQEKILPSNMLEITCLPGMSSENLIPSVNSGFTQPDPEKPVVSDNSSISVFLSNQYYRYTPGLVSHLSGYIVDENDKPVPYSRVLLRYGDVNYSQSNERVVEGFTNIKGIVEFNLSLSGPYPVFFLLEYPGKGTKPSVFSEKVVLIPDSFGINPPVKIIGDSESIMLYTDDLTVSSRNNITFYGFYNQKGGTYPSYQVLDLVWYNFGGQYWDTYQNSSTIATNSDGKFECTVPAPETSGMYLMSIRRPGNTTQSAVYSNVHPITVVPVDMNDANVAPDLIPVLRISANKSGVRVSESLDLSLQIFSPGYYEPVDIPVTMLYSKNGFDWMPLISETIFFNQDGQATITVRPDGTGYHYYRAIAGNDSLHVVSSDTLVIPVFSDL
ncbi:MAG: hypothetical protein GXY48_14215 [Methanomicrobiales archaeon]|nr:hypothetical protein [Methanomicrobiales archaeon]